ncbi:MAG: hypothetical protein Q8L14_30900 [Myxococcales bacterium]|nr:hypothetical protein [Myxococcales bacterium]
MSRALIAGVVFACASCAAHRAGLEREAVTLATDGNERFFRHLQRVTAALPSAPLSLPRRPATDFDGPRHEHSGLDLREDGEGRLGLAMGPGRGCGSVVPPDEFLFSTQPDGKLRITVVSAAIAERVVRVADPCGMAGCGAATERVAPQRWVLPVARAADVVVDRQPVAYELLTLTCHHPIPAP